MVQFVHLHPQCKQYTVIYMLSIFVHVSDAATRFKHNKWTDRFFQNVQQLCTSQLVPLIELDWSQDPSNQTVYPVGPDYRVHSDVRFVDGDQKKWFEQNFIDEHELEKTADRGEPEFGLWYPTRYRRQLPATTGGVSLGPQLMAMFKPVYVIRLAVFYDRKMSQMHNDKRELNSFIRGILQQVQLIYRYRSMQTRFRIQVLSIEQVSGSPLPDSAGGEVDRYLESFCAWQRIQHSRTASAQQWDHAILLTGERLYRLLDDGSKNYKVLGKLF